MAAAIDQGGGGAAPHGFMKAGQRVASGFTPRFQGSIVRRMGANAPGFRDPVQVRGRRRRK